MNQNEPPPNRAGIRNALVTGGARRLGRAIALGLADQGWSIAIHYHSSRSEAEVTVQDCLAAGAPRTVAVACDLRSPANRSRLVHDATAEWDEPLTLLVNNAASFERDNYSHPQPDPVATNLAVNLAAPLELIQHFVAQLPTSLRDQRDRSTPAPQVINILDSAVLRPSADFASYTVAKCGLAALTRNAALELAPHVRVNGVAPGPTLVAARESDEHFDASRRASPLQIGATPEDITAAVLYLVSTSAITGHILPVDGGLHLRTSAESE